MNRDGSVGSGERTRLACGRGRPALANFSSYRCFPSARFFPKFVSASAETSTRAARARAGKLCAPRIAAEPLVDI